MVESSVGVIENDLDKTINPSHYRARKDCMETIDEIRLLLTPEEFRGYLKGNYLKYRARAMYKNGEVDLFKSDWYIKTLKEESEEYDEDDWETEDWE